MTIAFDVVFGVFVAAIVTLAFVAVRWGVRRDRVARGLQAQRSAAEPPGPTPMAPTRPGPTP